MDKTHNFAIISLVLGCISIPLSCMYGIGVFVSVPAIYLGWRAKKEILESGMKIGGYNLALAGYIIGIVTTAISGLYFILLVVIIVLAIVSAASN